MGLVYVSQIKKLRKRLLVEPAPLWASSYTHLLYKAQDPFNYSDSPVGHHQRFLINLVPAIWMQDLSMFYRSRNSGRDFGWNQLPCGPVLTPISCTKLKIHSMLADSPVIIIIVPEQVFLKSHTGNLDEGTVYASQIKKLWSSFWWS